MNRSSTRIVGVLREVFRDERSVTIEWTIPDYSHIPPGLYATPTVNYFNTNWYLEIRKLYEVLCTVWLHKALSPAGTPEPVFFTMGWTKLDGREEVIVRDQTFPEGSEQCQVYVLAYGRGTLRFTLRKNDAPGISLKTRTEIESCSDGRKDEHSTPGFKGVSRGTQTKEAPGQSDEPDSNDISILREHFEKLLLSGDDHDVLIKVEKKQFRAHKNILKARSPVFAAMFGHDMAEDTVTVEVCDPDAFGQFLHYVYTGSVDIASVEIALGLYHAGDEFDFPSLKEKCLQYLALQDSFTVSFTTVLDGIDDEEEVLMQQAIVHLSC